MTSMSDKRQGASADILDVRNRDGYVFVLCIVNWIYSQDGRLMVVGGRNENVTLLNTVEAFDSTSDTWTSLNNMTVGKYQHCQVNHSLLLSYCINVFIKLIDQ